MKNNTWNYKSLLLYVICNHLSAKDGVYQYVTIYDNAIDRFLDLLL